MRSPQVTTEPSDFKAAKAEMVEVMDTTPEVSWEAMLVPTTLKF